ncbi:odorant/gustatory chemosensory receptor-like 122 [Plakobranchus ocellatus]|uniref:Odorant/gustatory chemosensory receptor-like 122 n=1 Tax=Plakobranchus ocellatus TaxID=259542 RepID=A0AAV4C7Y0_9GAST|nr:odorant/gustatory chemosensory receptor-like 122 [Plakobranchus ocellatus]
MQARNLVQSLEADPPEPFHEGCAKIALTSLLNSLRFTGLYHEHDYCDTISPISPTPPTEIQSLSVESLNSRVDLKTAQNKALPLSIRKMAELEKGTEKRGNWIDLPRGKEIATIRMGSIKDSTVSSPDANSDITLSKPLHEHEEKFHEVHNSDEITFVRNSKLNKVKLSSLYKEGLGSKSSTPGHSQSTTGTRDEIGASSISTSSSIQSKKYVHSLDNPGNYLGRCGLMQNPLGSPVLQALGYCSTHSQEVVLQEQYTRCGKRKFDRKIWWRRLLSDRTFAFCIMMMLWANLLRMCQYIRKDYGISFPMLVIPGLWFAITAGSSTLLFISCSRPTHFLLFFKRWHFIYMAFYVNGKRSVVTIIVTFVVLFFCTCAWTGPPVMIVIFCKLITSHFEEFDEIFRLHVTAAGDQLPKRLRLLRECHLAMCATVEILDRYIRLASGLIFSIAITLACFLLYIMVNFSLDVTATLVVAFWLVSSVFLVGIITHYMGSVSQSMHSVNSSLQTLQTRNASIDQLGQLQMFLSKTSGQTMGFSVFGLITVTSDLSLTLLSLYITYAVVLLQFK